MVLPFFPTPYPDEDFRSVIYRYHIRSENRTMHQTNLELFHASTYGNPLIPRNLMAFLQMMPEHCGLLPDKILIEHTLWPLFKPLMSKRQIDACMQGILYGTGDDVSIAISVLPQQTNRISTTDIRYCPRCLENDNETYGECFVHRTHQIALLDTCMIHNVKLVTYCPLCHVRLAPALGHRLLLGKNCPNGHALSMQGILDERELNIQKNYFAQLQEFMNQSISLNRELLMQRIEIMLIHKGYISFSRKFNRNKLLSDIENDLSQPNMISQREHTLKAINISRGNGGLTNPTSGIRNLPAILYLLVFLSGSVNRFFELPISLSMKIPFGLGPWKCINLVCPDRDQAIITYCERKLVQKGDVVGIFSCPICGGVYKKKWNSAEEKTNKTIKTLLRGHIWDRTLFTLVHQGLSYPEIARRLGVHESAVARAQKKAKDVGKVSTQALFNPLGAPQDEVAATVFSTLDTDLLIKHKNRILDVLKEDVNTEGIDVRRKAKHSIRWVRKYDPHWVEAVLPPPRKSVKLPWGDLDSELAEKIEVAAVQTYLSDPPRRIGCFTIMKLLPNSDQNRLLDYRDRLPNSWAILYRYKESQEHYLIRQIPAVVKKFIQMGHKNVTLKTVLSRGKTYHGCSIRVREEIIRILRNMGFSNVEQGMNDYM